MMRAAKQALGSPDHKAFLTPLILQGFDSKLLQCSNVLNSQTWGHVQWVPPGVPRQAWCTAKSLSLAKWLTSTSPKGATVLSAHLARDSPSPRSIRVCLCCVGVLLGSVLGALGVSAAFGVFSVHCEGQSLGVPCRTAATRR